MFKTNSASTLLFLVAVSYAAAADQKKSKLVHSITVNVLRNGIHTLQVITVPDSNLIEVMTNVATHQYCRPARTMEESLLRIIFFSSCSIAQP
jgi:hypothetical protein